MFLQVPAVGRSFLRVRVVGLYHVAGHRGINTNPGLDDGLQSEWASTISHLDYGVSLGSPVDDRSWNAGKSAGAAVVVFFAKQEHEVLVRSLPENRTMMASRSAL